jgi:hypothetical protein
MQDKCAAQPEADRAWRDEGLPQPKTPDATAGRAPFLAAASATEANLGADGGAESPAAASQCSQEPASQSASDLAAPSTMPTLASAGTEVTAAASGCSQEPATPSTPATGAADPPAIHHEQPVHEEVCDAWPCCCLFRQRVLADSIHNC